MLDKGVGSVMEVRFTRPFKEHGIDHIPEDERRARPSSLFAALPGGSMSQPMMKSPNGMASSAYTSSVVRPIESVWAWQQSARCRGVNTELFFSADGEGGEARRHRQQRAKEICGKCPVRSQCRDFAMRSRQSFGIWGGMTELERSQALERFSLGR